MNYLLLSYHELRYYDVPNIYLTPHSTLPFGGLFLAGGLAPKLLPRIKTVLKPAFLTDPIMGDLLAQVPLYVVMNEDVGLVGAKVRALRLALS